MEMEFRVYRAGKIVFRSLHIIPEVSNGEEVNKLHVLAVEEFRKAFPHVAFLGDEYTIRWAKPSSPEEIPGT